jgi:hypothetical protein
MKKSLLIPIILCLLCNITPAAAAQYFTTTLVNRLDINYEGAAVNPGLIKPLIITYDGTFGAGFKKSLPMPAVGSSITISVLDYSPYCVKYMAYGKNGECLDSFIPQTKSSTMYLVQSVNYPEYNSSPVTIVRMLPTKKN